uniref:(northern house mosquito) hypothetical protein n=1 Tax=Culex pipiens TaxID=7175 RepID=A0A8D8NMA9_CULPI
MEGSEREQFVFRQGSIIYWLFVMQRYAPQSNREKLRAEKCRRLISILEFQLDTGRVLCLCAKTTNLIQFINAIYIKRECIRETAEIWPKFHNSRIKQCD